VVPFTIVERPTNPEGGRPPLWILDPGWNFYDTIHLYVPRPEAEGGWQVYAAGRCFPSREGRRNGISSSPRLERPRHMLHPHHGHPAAHGGPDHRHPRPHPARQRLQDLGTALLLGFFATLMLGNLAIYLYTGNSKYKWFVLSNLTFASFVATTSYQHLIVSKTFRRHHDGRSGGPGHRRHDGQDVF
jgi:two-component system, sensor histidine kinase and response regulator